jgi:hypothetical protein
MKSNGTIKTLLQRKVHNEHDYYHRVIYPLLDYLGVPDDGTVRWPQFPIFNPFGEGKLKLDYLLRYRDVPLVVVEGKPSESLFEQGFKQARDYARNFEPATKRIRPMTVPFLLVAAGSKARMFRAVAKGINIEYEFLDGFLEWNELAAEAAAFTPLEKRPPGVITEEEVLRAEFARQFFDDVYSAIYSIKNLRGKDDQRVILFNRIIRAAAKRDKKPIQRLCQKEGISQRATSSILNALSWYEDQFRRKKFQGPAVALAYRDFITSNKTRQGLKLFTGTSQSRPYYEKGKLRYRRTGRFFTPTEIIRQMVRLCRIQPDDKVIDFTCGSGGYLAEALMAVANNEPERVRDFLAENLVGIDDDPFCAETTRTLLSFLHPDYEDRLKVFLHNGLYKEAPLDGEYDEDPAAEPYLEIGQYDVVIGNPPGNKQYSGSNGSYVAELWAERYGITTRLWDHVFFVKRAIDLARPDGGRVCILVPYGFLANLGFEALRNEALRDCEIHAVISLPRVFKNNSAEMAILYMMRNPRWNREHKVLVASVPSTTMQEDPESGTLVEVSTNIYAELEGIVDQYFEIEHDNRGLPPGSGLTDFSEGVSARATETTEAEENEEKD